MLARLKRISLSPITGAVGWTVSALWDAVWFMGPLIGYDPPARRIYLLVGFIALLGFTAYAFWAVLYREAAAAKDRSADMARVYEQHRAEVDELAKQVESLKAQNLGIDIRFSELSLLYNDDDKTEPWQDLDGVLLLLGIERLVNRNQVPASLELTFHVPIRFGAMQFVLGVPPEPVPRLDVVERMRVPFMTRPLNLPPKHGIGPCYMLFNFRASGLAPFPFNAMWHNRSTAELARLIEQSEMYVEITDVANGTPTQRVLAPGTAPKRQKRLAAEYDAAVKAQAAKEAEAGSASSTTSSMDQT